MTTPADTFERRFSAAALTTLTPQSWDLLIRTINARLRGVEDKKASFEEAERVLLQLGLARINDALLPAFLTIQGLANLGAMFTATSTTTLAVGTGVKQMTIPVGVRDRFAPAAYLAIRHAEDPDVAMTGELSLYHRETGTLEVLVDNVRGEGSHANWIVSASPAPNLDGYTNAQVDALIEALGEDINALGSATLDALATKLNASAVSSFILGLLDDADAAAARTTLGLGSAAVEAAGTGNNNVLKLNGSGKAASSIYDFATQGEAEAGTDTNKPLNALRTKQAIEALATLAVTAQQFDASATWNKPAKGTWARIQAWGGGGGGGRSSSGNNHGTGGGGGYAELWMPLSALPSSVSVTIGAGGIGRTGSAGSGTAGGTTSFGSYVSATGGQEGAGTGGGAGGMPYGHGTAYGDINNTISHLSLWAGGSFYPNNGQTHLRNAIFGGASGAKTGDSTPTSTFGGNGGVGAGAAGSAPGGGGGAHNTSGSNGGDGAAGRVIVTVF